MPDTYQGEPCRDTGLQWFHHTRRMLQSHCKKCQCIALPRVHAGMSSILYNLDFIIINPHLIIKFNLMVFVLQSIFKVPGTLSNTTIIKLRARFAKQRREQQQKEPPRWINSRWCGHANFDLIHKLYLPTLPNYNLILIYCLTNTHSCKFEVSKIVAQPCLSPKLRTIIYQCCYFSTQRSKFWLLFYHITRFLQRQTLCDL